jgi:RND family efflux transporter MFP subunit
MSISPAFVSARKHLASLPPNAQNNCMDGRTSIGGFLVFVAAASIFSACTGSLESTRVAEQPVKTATPNELQSASPPIRKVQQALPKGATIEEIERRELPIFLSLKGVIRSLPSNESDVSTRIIGKVVRVAVHLGDKVSTGQLLAVLDSKEISELEAEMIEAKSQVRIARARREREKQIMDEQVQRPKALIDAQEHYDEKKAQDEFTESEFQRQEGLRKEKISSGRAYLEAKTEHLQAHAAFEQAKLELQREQSLYKNKALLSKDFEIADAEADHAAQHLDTLKQRLLFLGMDQKSIDNVLSSGKISGEHNIIAPVSGVISHEDVAVGEVVESDHSMFKILDLSEVDVKGEVPESEIALIKLGDKVTVTVPSYPDEEFVATIDYLSDHVNPETHMLAIQARLNNKNCKLKTNMSAEIDLDGPKRIILACPKAALIHDKGNVLVFVVENRHFLLKPIILGLTAKDYVEVKAGLNEKDKVVVGSHLTLSELQAKAR